MGREIQSAESLSAKNPNETTNETTFQNFGEIKTFSGK